MLNFRTCVLVSVVLVLVGAPRNSAASSYCPGCTAAIAATGGALAGGVAATIYYVHRSHTSLKGCVLQSNDAFNLTTQNGKTYGLLAAPPGLKSHERVLLRGQKGGSSSDRTFRVDRISHDYGACE
jgi:hypothetical protein